MQCEAYAVHEKWLTERPQDYGARARERLLAGAFYRAVDYVQALRMRTKLIARFAEAMRDVAVAIPASSMEPACDRPEARSGGQGLVGKCRSWGAPFL